MAIISPAKRLVQTWAEENDVKAKEFNEIIKDSDVINMYKEEIKKTCRSAGVRFVL